MNIPNPSLLRSLTRRSFLARSGAGVGSAALASLMNPGLFADNAKAAPDKWTGVLDKLHYPRRCKRVIHLCMAGGMTHLETFDYKKVLGEMHGKPMPESMTKGQPIAQLQGRKLTCMGPQHEFKNYGRSGQHMTSLFPNIGKVADDVCIVRSLHTEQINHDPAHTFMNTGALVSGRPSMGSWLLYGLGAEADDLPGFVVLTSLGKGGQAQPIAARQWHSGFLPSNFQGVQFHSKGDPVHYVGSPKGVDRAGQKDVVDTVNSLNRVLQGSIDDPEIATRIAQYEMAFKMQASVPDLMDTSKEPQKILDLYGAKPGDGSYASNCLLARRLAERGTRFIQLYHRSWDHHGDVKGKMKVSAKEVDQATMALITDLKQRGMLDETLIIFGSEFGRTPMAQGSGRDHHIKGFSMMLAGGGIKPGSNYGATDDFGYNAVQDKVHVSDLHATMLYLMGVEHTKLNYRFQGLDFRLTGVAGNVLKPLVG